MAHHQQGCICVVSQNSCVLVEGTRRGVQNDVIHLGLQPQKHLLQLGIFQQSNGILFTGLATPKIDAKTLGEADEIPLAQTFVPEHFRHRVAAPDSQQFSIPLTPQVQVDQHDLLSLPGQLLRHIDGYRGLSLTGRTAGDQQDFAPCFPHDRAQPQHQGVDAFPKTVGRSGVQNRNILTGSAVLSGFLPYLRQGAQTFQTGKTLHVLRSLNGVIQECHQQHKSCRKAQASASPQQQNSLPAGHIVRCFRRLELINQIQLNVPQHKP